MNFKNTKYLLKKYPKLYIQFYLPMTETCMCWGFMCEDGWLKLIDELSGKIVKLNKDIEACEVKEKFGGLRFYIDGGNKKIWDLINKYEEKSFTICEKCGKSGRIRGTNWYITLCNKCNEKWKKKN